jgi:hypothetical protein
MRTDSLVGSSELNICMMPATRSGPGVYNKYGRNPFLQVETLTILSPLMWFQFLRLFVVSVCVCLYYASALCNTDEDRTAARNAAICTAQCQVQRCGPSDERAPDFGAVVGDYEMGLEISDAEPLTTFDRASQPLSEESYSHGGDINAGIFCRVRPR